MRIMKNNCRLALYVLMACFTCRCRPALAQVSSGDGIQKFAEFGDFNIRLRESAATQMGGTESGRQIPRSANAGFSKELIQIFASPDALGVASGREATIRYNSVNVIAGLAYQDRQVECRLACANQSHRSCAIRVHCIGTRAGTPDQRNIAVYRDCGHLGQLAVAVERRFGNAINKERPSGHQNLPVNRKCVTSFDSGICTLPATGRCP